MESESEMKSGLPVVFLIDDDHMMHDLIKIILEGVADLRSAYCFDEAETYLNQPDSDPVMMLVDLNLGRGGNGVDLLKSIKQMPRFAGVPVVAVTAYSMSGDDEKLLEEGFDYFLSKPFRKRILLEIFNKVLALK